MNTTESRVCDLASRIETGKLHTRTLPQLYAIAILHRKIAPYPRVQNLRFRTPYLGFPIRAWVRPPGYSSRHGYTPNAGKSANRF